MNERLTGSKASAPDDTDERELQLYRLVCAKYESKGIKEDPRVGQLLLGLSQVVKDWQNELKHGTGAVSQPPEGSLPGRGDPYLGKSFW